MATQAKVSMDDFKASQRIRPKHDALEPGMHSKLEPGMQNKLYPHTYYPRPLTIPGNI